MLQTNKATIESRLSELDGQVQELGNPIDTQTELKVRRDKEIQELVERIQSNQGNIETYIESHEQVKREFAEKILGLDKKIDEFAKRQGERQVRYGKIAIKTKEILDRVGKKKHSLQKVVSTETTAPKKSEQKPTFKPLSEPAPRPLEKP